MRLNGEDKDRGGTRRGYVEMDGVILRREGLDHIIVLDEQHLMSVLAEFVRFYNQERPHRTLDLQTPEPRPRPTTGSIRSRPC